MRTRRRLPRGSQPLRPSTTGQRIVTVSRSSTGQAGTASPPWGDAIAQAGFELDEGVPGQEKPVSRLGDKVGVEHGCISRNDPATKHELIGARHGVLVAPFPHLRPHRSVVGSSADGPNALIDAADVDEVGRRSKTVAFARPSAMPKPLLARARHQGRDPPTASELAPRAQHHGTSITCACGRADACQL